MAMLQASHFIFFNDFFADKTDIIPNMVNRTFETRLWCSMFFCLYRWTFCFLAIYLIIFMRNEGLLIWKLCFVKNLPSAINCW